jgi:hypothetical protein
VSATWGRGAAPSQPHRRTPGVIIAAAVAGIAVLGGIFGLINLASDKPEAVGATLDPAVVPTAVPDPGVSPSTLPLVTVPGPQPPPTVVTTTVPSATTTSTPPSPPPPGSGSQLVLDRIAVAVPPGWDVLDAEQGSVLLGTEGAQYHVLASTAEADAEALVRTWVADPGGLESYTVTHASAVEAPSSSVVSAFVATWEAVLVTQQGTLPVEGVVNGYVTQDGIGVLTETFNAIGDFESFSADYSAMLGSIIATL